MKKMSEKVFASCSSRGFYLTVEQLVKMHGVSDRHVREILHGIREEIKSGRYNRYAVLEDGRVLINLYAYYDYCKYRQALSDPKTREFVPEFNPAEIAAMCPVMERVILVDPEDAKDRTATNDYIRETMASRGRSHG